MNHENEHVDRPRYLFVTGRLAEFALRQVLDELAPRAGFTAEVAVLPISVAALMTPEVGRPASRCPRGNRPRDPARILPGRSDSDRRKRHGAPPSSRAPRTSATCRATSARRRPERRLRRVSTSRSWPRSTMRLG